MAYATPATLIKQFDVRTLGDLAEDTGVRVTPTALLTDPNVAYALSRGAGAINAACQVAQRYTQAQLAALTGDDAAILQGLNADLAFVYLCQRRGLTPPAYKETYDRAAAVLEKLESGALIFNVSAAVSSGVPTTNFISGANYERVGTLRARTPQLFPVRRDQRTAP